MSQLTDYQDETLSSLDEMIDELHSKISCLQDEIATIEDVKRKFQEQILKAEMKFKQKNTN